MFRIFAPILPQTVLSILTLFIQKYLAASPSAMSRTLQGSFLTLMFLLMLFLCIHHHGTTNGFQSESSEELEDEDR